MNKKILVIEDDRSILDALKLTLEYAGYDATLADNGEYIERLKKHSKEELPDIIILDILLSGKDGRAICKALKADPATAHIPVIMISAHPRAEKSVKEAGADDFLAKPFNIPDLLALLKKHSH